MIDGVYVHTLRLVYSKKGEVYESILLNKQRSSWRESQMIARQFKNMAYTYHKILWSAIRLNQNHFGVKEHYKVLQKTPFREHGTDTYKVVARETYSGGFMLELRHYREEFERESS